MQGDAPEQRLAMPLLVLLAQQRKLIVMQSQVGWVFGKRWLGLQFAQLLCCCRRSSCTVKLLAGVLSPPHPTPLPPCCSPRT